MSCSFYAGLLDTLTFEQDRYDAYHATELRRQYTYERETTDIKDTQISKLYLEYLGARIHSADRGAQTAEDVTRFSNLSILMELLKQEVDAVRQVDILRSIKCITDSTYPNSSILRYPQIASYINQYARRVLGIVPSMARLRCQEETRNTHNGYTYKRLDWHEGERLTWEDVIAFDTSTARDLTYTDNQPWATVGHNYRPTGATKKTGPYRQQSDTLIQFLRYNQHIDLLQHTAMAYKTMSPLDNLYQHKQLMQNTKKRPQLKKGLQAAITIQRHNRISYTAELAFVTQEPSVAPRQITSPSNIMADMRWSLNPRLLEYALPWADEWPLYQHLPKETLSKWPRHILDRCWPSDTPYSFMTLHLYSMRMRCRFDVYYLDASNRLCKRTFNQHHIHTWAPSLFYHGDGHFSVVQGPLIEQ